ncbi:hypothetical protein HA402_010768 [Bradysia odoriphaga]|nr:hypothetical protein HA402_010768 [Bradysia odoriphaga]
MSTTCKINFADNLNVFYTGQVIRGTVQLKLGDCIIIRSVSIQFFGVAHIESAGNQLSSRTEIYLNSKLYLVGSDEDNSKPIRLLHGKHDYSFDCRIPAKLPTSVEGKYGHIRYIARIVLNLTSWPNQMKFEEPFTVIRPRDLNLHPSLGDPVIVRRNETFLSSNPLIMVARLPVGGYVPGQTINLKLSVNNQSAETVLRFNVQMIKEIFYSIGPSDDQKRTETVTLYEADTVGCDKKRDDIIFVNIPVPSVPPNDSCNIINIKYSVRIKGDMEDCLYSSPVLNIPLIIGTYPLKDGAVQTIASDLNEAMAPSDAPDEDKTIPSNCIVPSAPPMLSNFDDDSSAPEYQSEQSFFPQDDPPTYEEAMMSDTEANKFRPKYPMYGRQTSYSIGD